MTHDPYSGRTSAGGQVYPTPAQTPAPGGSGLPPMGWYPDPAGSAEERYWDGTSWTHNLRAPQPPVPTPGPGDLPTTATLAPWGTPHVQPGQQHQRPEGSGSSGATAYQPQQPTGQGQSHPGQSYPGQSYPGQSYPGQSYPGQSYQGQYGQQYPVQGHPAGPWPAASQQVAGPSPEAGQPAPWGRRLLGLVIDVLLVYVLGSLLTAPIASHLSEATNDLLNKTNAGEMTTPSALWNELVGSGYLRWMLIIMGVQMLAAIVMFTVGNRLGGTLGHRAAGVAVVPAGSRPAPAPFGAPAPALPRLGWGAALVRALVVVVLLYVPLGVILLGIWPLATSSGRGLHDLASRSRTVRR